MKYARILMAVACEPWAMQPEKLLAMVDFLRMQASGVKFSAEEVEARISKQQEKEISRMDGSVAILPLRGIIANRMNMFSEISGGTSVEGFTQAFTAALRAPDVKAIVIDVDSPGGTVHGSDELSELIFNARGQKPIVAHVNELAASAAYWIASAADEVVAVRSAEVGSIGVFTVHEDISKMLSELGVKETLIKAGRFKAEDMPFEPLSEDARAHIQERVDAYYRMFVKAVARNRGAAQQAVTGGFGQGRVVGAEAAVTEGMIDSVATLEETVRRFGATTFAPPARRRALAPEREKRALSLHRIG